MESWREELYRDELYHHGVLGMKWGVRRFQNEDGTLTPAGKRRYGSTPEKVDREVLTSQIDKTLFRESRSSDYNNQIRDEAYEKAENTEEGKRLREIVDEASQMNEEAEKLGIRLVYSDDYKNEYEQAVRDYISKVNDFINSSETREKLSSLLLTDIGYEDTKAGREYVSDILNQMFEGSRSDEDYDEDDED